MFSEEYYWDLKEECSFSNKNHCKLWWLLPHSKKTLKNKKKNPKNQTTSHYCFLFSIYYFRSVTDRSRLSIFFFPLPSQIPRRPQN